MSNFLKSPVILQQGYRAHLFILALFMAPLNLAFILKVISLENPITTLIAFLLNLFALIYYYKISLMRFRALFPDTKIIDDLIIFLMLSLPFVSIFPLLVLILSSDKTKKRSLKDLYTRSIAVSIIMTTIVFMIQIQKGHTLYGKDDPTRLSLDLKDFMVGTILFGQLDAMGKYAVAWHLDMKRINVMEAYIKTEEKKYCYANQEYKIQENFCKSLNLIDQLPYEKSSFTAIGMNSLVEKYTQHQLSKGKKIELFQQGELSPTVVETKEENRVTPKLLTYIRRGDYYYSMGSSVLFGMPVYYLISLVEAKLLKPLQAKR